MKNGPKRIKKIAQRKKKYPEKKQQKKKGSLQRLRLVYVGQTVYCISCVKECVYNLSSSFYKRVTVVNCLKRCGIIQYIEKLAYEGVHTEMKANVEKITCRIFFQHRFTYLTLNALYCIYIFTSIQN